MVDEAKAELFGNPLLKSLKLIVDEFNDVARLHIDQMIVMLVRGRFIAGASVAEFMPGKNSGFLEQPNRPVNGGDGYFGIDR